MPKLQRLGVLADRFVPPSLKQTTEQHRRARLTASSILALLPWTPISMSVVYYSGLPEIYALTPLVGAMVAASGLWVLKYLKSQTGAANVLAFAMVTVVLGFSLVTGGTHSPLLLVTGFYPMILIYLTGAMWSAVWTGLMLLGVGILYLLERQGVTFVQDPAIAQSFFPLGYGILMVSAHGLSYLYEHSRSQQQQLILSQQQQLIYTSKMAALGEMAAGVAHEINNPLAIQRLIAQQLSRQARTGASDMAALHSGADKLAASVDRISSIVRSLLVFAREGGEEQLEPIAIDSLLGQAQDLCEERFRSSDMRFERAMSAPGLRVPAKAGQLVQAMLILLNNAYDALEGASGDKRVSLSLEQHGSCVQIRVADTGPGLTDEAITKAFQPFFTTKGVGKGTGLGLSVARGIAEAHGGKLEIERPREPTVFLLELPA